MFKDKKLENAMNALWKSVNVPSLSATIPKLDLEEKIKEAEEWIWVEGYKGTYKDMTCANDYQFELGKRFDMDCENDEIKQCEKGFHLCLNIEDVFKYYKIGDGNRFFKVKALVRKSEHEKYGKAISYWDMMTRNYINKLVSKSIIFEEEVSEDVIIKEARKHYFEDWMDVDDDTVRAYITGDRDAVMKDLKLNLLMKDGYSELVARYIIRNLPGDRVERAHALAAQEGLSMDVKMLCIMTGDDD